MLPRFYAPDAGESGAAVTLPPDEATHASRVLRLASGAAVRVFNGRGAEWDAEIRSVARGHVTVRLLNTVAPVPEPRIPILLAISCLKADKMDHVVRDAVMMGATAIQPVIATRSEISLSTLTRSGRIGRWQRIAVASAKQCGRAVVPPVRPATSAESLLNQPPEQQRIMLVEPAAASGKTPSASIEAVASEVIVGPEGGWTDDEIALAERSGSRLLTLGSRTLRADAVPIVALTVLRVMWQDL